MADPRDLLPPGFRIESASDPQASLPAGFQIEGQQQPPMMVSAMTDPSQGVRMVPAPQPSQQPSLADFLRTSAAIGAPAQTLLRAGQGASQLGARTVEALMPNETLRAPVSAFRQGLEASSEAQNKGYEAAKARMVNTSSNPRTLNAMIGTGETMGNIINPAGMAGNVVPEVAALGPVANAALRGGASGLGFAASQPVQNPDNYWSQKAGQLAVGGPVGAITGAAVERLGQTRQTPPTTKELKSAATEAYKTAEAEGVVIKQPSVQNTVNGITEAIQKEGIDPQLQPKTTAVLNRFVTEAKTGNMTLEKAETLRRIASSALDTPDKSDRRLAHMVIDKWDDFIGGLKPDDVTGGVTGDPALIKALNLPTGNQQVATDALSQARDLYARSAKSAEIERLMERAKNAVGANYTTAGYETALRQQFRALANKDAAFRRFSPDEQQAILKVVRGGPVENVLRMAGKFAIRGPVSGGMTGGLGYLMGGPAGIAGLEAAGEAGRYGATQLGLRNVRLAHELMRSGGQPSFAPMPQSGPSPNVPVGNAATALMVQLLMKPRTQ
jgi:hypothetical protein